MFYLLIIKIHSCLNYTHTHEYIHNSDTTYLCGYKTMKTREAKKKISRCSFFISHQ